MQRPTGVTILAVLGVIGGVLGILGSFTLIGGGALLASAIGVSGGLIMLIGVIGLVSSVLALAFGIGAWTLKPWAWMLGIAAEGLSLLTAVIGIVAGLGIGSQLVSIIIAGAVIYYLMTPPVKQAFGRA